mgnify:FL=1|uniref:Ribonuclease HII n=1 Tax=viral metagenome TaxID=1070528 RepID=A0A6C0ELE6_9ZZZZ
MTTTDYSLLDRRVKANPNPLKICHNDDENIYEIGIDEVGRGPLIGRVYSAAVVLPKDNSFRHDWMKDSKKFSNKEKLKLTEDYIKKHALAYAICYEDEKTIDQINILQATFKSMHCCIKEVIAKMNQKINCELLVDGNNFKSYIINEDDEFISIPHTCVTSGDNTYASIAAASILAKVARDEYVEKLCDENPLLDDYYGITTNKGYGVLKHREGIKKHGISKWHRLSFGICKENVDRIWS